MFIETKVFTIKEGHSEKLLTKFSQGGKMSLSEGFLEFSVLKRMRKGEHEEIMVMTRWEDQKSFTNWKNSDAHKAGHSGKHERPDFIVDVRMDTYTVEKIQTK